MSNTKFEPARYSFFCYPPYFKFIHSAVSLIVKLFPRSLLVPACKNVGWWLELEKTLESIRSTLGCLGEQCNVLARGSSMWPSLLNFLRQGCLWHPIRCNFNWDTLLGYRLKNLFSSTLCLSQILSHSRYSSHFLNCTGEMFWSGTAGTNDIGCWHGTAHPHLLGVSFAKP